MSPLHKAYKLHAPKDLDGFQPSSDKVYKTIPTRLQVGYILLDRWIYTTFRSFRAELLHILYQFSIYISNIQSPVQSRFYKIAKRHIAIYLSIYSDVLENGFKINNIINNYSPILVKCLCISSKSINVF